MLMNAESGDFTGTRVIVLDGGSRQILPIIKELHGLKCDVTTFVLRNLIMDMFHGIQIIEY